MISNEIYEITNLRMYLALINFLNIIPHLIFELLENFFDVF